MRCSRRESGRNQSRKLAFLVGSTMWAIKARPRTDPETWLCLAGRRGPIPSLGFLETRLCLGWLSGERGEKRVGTKSNALLQPVPDPALPEIRLARLISGPEAPKPKTNTSLICTSLVLPCRWTGREGNPMLHISPVAPGTGGRPHSPKSGRDGSSLSCRRARI